jgi:rRNA-processing protein FCF1
MHRARLALKFQRQLELEREIPKDCRRVFSVMTLRDSKIIFDTCSLLATKNNLEAMKKLCDHNLVCVPQVVVLELDALSKSPDAMLSLAAHQARNLLSELFAERLIAVQCGSPEGGTTCPVSGVAENGDYSIIAYASYLKASVKDIPLFVCTEDKVLSLRVRAMGIFVCSVGSTA